METVAVPFKVEFKMHGKPLDDFSEGPIQVFMGNNITGVICVHVVDDEGKKWMYEFDAKPLRITVTGATEAERRYHRMMLELAEGLEKGVTDQ